MGSCRRPKSTIAPICCQLSTYTDLKSLHPSNRTIIASLPQSELSPSRVMPSSCYGPPSHFQLLHVRSYSTVQYQLRSTSLFIIPLPCYWSSRWLHFETPPPNSRTPEPSTNLPHRANQSPLSRSEQLISVHGQFTNP